jgi:hypothetical protein
MEDPMKYLALIYGSERDAEAGGEAAMNALIEEYMQYEAWLDREHPGKKLGGDALLPTPTATTIRVRAGARTLTDGPFAETKEQLGGYYLFDVKDLDEAIALAERIPDAKYGCVEVRPIMVIEG